MKRLTVFLAVVIALAVTAPAFAQANSCTGPHYTLNIIGVPKDKTVPTMTGSNRHVIFVPLQSGGDVSRQVKIQYIAGDEFRVIDGNATDDNLAIIEVPSSSFGDLCYDVYATALGKPNGNAIVTAECTYDDPASGGPGDTTFDESCTDTLLLNTFTVNRTNGKPKAVNISDIFRATGCIDVNNNGVLDSGDYCFNNVWIFNVPALLSYFWDYDNNGLRLMQIRFCETTCGSFTTVP